MCCEGFIVITGEVGAGKTTIVRGLPDSLDSDSVVAANLVSTQLGLMTRYGWWGQRLASQ